LIERRKKLYYQRKPEKRKHDPITFINDKPLVLKPGLNYFDGVRLMTK